MAGLTGSSIKNTYKDILQVDNGNAGIDGTLRTISDGEGTTGPIQLSSTALHVVGTFTVGVDIISDTDSTDSLGSTGVRWANGWFDSLTSGTLTLAAGSITDSSGAISFGDEALTTTGTLASGNITADGTNSTITLGDSTGLAAGETAQLFFEDGGVTAARLRYDLDTQDLDFISLNGGNKFYTNNTLRLEIAAAGGADFQANAVTTTGLITGGDYVSTGRIGLGTGGIAVPDTAEAQIMVNTDYSVDESGMAFQDNISTIFHIGADEANNSLVIGYGSKITTNTALKIANTGHFDFQAGNLTTTGLATVGEIDLSEANPQIRGMDTNGTLTIAANTAAAGANIQLLGDAATAANDVYFREGGNNTLHYDDSLSLWNFQANDITTTGTVTGGAVTPGTATWTSGTATPEGAVTAPVGSLFSRTDGGTSTSFYVKESGAGNTGWVAK